MLTKAIRSNKQALVDALLARPNLNVDLGDVLIDTLYADSHYATQILDHPQFEEYMWSTNGLHVVHRMFMKDQLAVGSFDVILAHDKILPHINAPARAFQYDGQTALHFTASSFNWASTYAGLLLLHGADANAVDQRGRTPAHLAVQEHQPALLRELLPYTTVVHLKSVMMAASLDGTAEMMQDIRQELRRRLSSALRLPRPNPATME